MWENINRILTEQEMDEAKANTVDLDAISHMEAPASEFEMRQAGMYCSGQPVYGMVSQPVDDGYIYKSPSVQRERLCTSLKHFP